MWYIFEVDWMMLMEDVKDILDVDIFKMNEIRWYINILILLLKFMDVYNYWVFNDKKKIIYSKIWL